MQWILSIGGCALLVSLWLKLLLLAPPAVTCHGAHVQNQNEPTQLGGTCALGLSLTPIESALLHGELAEIVIVLFPFRCIGKCTVPNVPYSRYLGNKVQVQLFYVLYCVWLLQYILGKFTCTIILCTLVWDKLNIGKLYLYYFWGKISTYWKNVQR